MPSLEQIQTLSALKKKGTFMQTAEFLGKGYTSVNYNIKTLEDELGIKLLDRSGYRTKLTPNGHTVLEASEQLLKAHENLLKLVETLKNGWEPQITVVYDGVINIRPVIRALTQIKKLGVTTRFTTNIAFHDQVESEFLRLNADFMMSISPPKEVDLPYISLPPIQVYLVASAHHELIKMKQNLSISDLKNYSLVTVHGSSIRLGLSTLELEQQSPFTVSDFESKKLVIMEGLGYGWLPEYTIKSELKRGLIKKIPSEIPNQHKFFPRLYHRPMKTMGKSGHMLLEYLQNLLKTK